MSHSLPPAAVKYLHRRWRDADCYFSSTRARNRNRSAPPLSGMRPAQTWDADTGRSPLVAGVAGKGAVHLHLNLAPYESRFIVVGATEAPKPASGHFSRVFGALTWRRHSCLPRRHSCRRSAFDTVSLPRTGIETSLDTAGTSACATFGGSVRNAR